MSSASVIQMEGVFKYYRIGEYGYNSFQEDVRNILSKRKHSAIRNDGHEKSGYLCALQDVNIEINKGDILALVGSNGSGKSTLLKLIAGITTPTMGSVRTRGRIASLLEVGTGFHPELTGRENIFLNGSILGMKRSEINSKIDEIIEFSGCQLFIDTPIKRYSSGMIVRLGFAVAAHLLCDILIVDEVLAVGDQEFRRLAIARIEELSRSNGTTVLFVSHNTSVVRSLCKNAVLLENGKVNATGTLSDVLNSYASEATGEGNRVEFELENGWGISAVEVDRNGLQVGNFQLKVEYVASGGMLARPGFVVYSEAQQPLFSSNTTMHPPVEHLKDHGTAIYVCNDLPMHEGEYYLSVWLGNDLQMDERIFCLKFSFHPAVIVQNKPDIATIGNFNLGGEWNQEGT